MLPRSAIGAAVIAILIVGPLAARSGAAEETSLAARCPAYALHLRTARNYLERGHRAAATAELRRARVALEACGREEATQRGLLAVRDLSAARG
jgi:hypothetical protein